MIFHGNRLLADDSHVIYLIFVENLGKMSQNKSSAAVMIGALVDWFMSHFSWFNTVHECVNPYSASIFVKMLSAFYICCINSFALQTSFDHESKYYE